MFRLPISGKRLMAGAVLGGAGACGILWMRLMALELDTETLTEVIHIGSQVAVAAALLLLPAGMIRLCFGWKDWRTFLKLYVMLYFEAFLAGGILEAGCQQIESRNLPFWAMFFLVLGAGFLTRFFYLFYREVRQERKHCYPVLLINNGKWVHATGYLDTGNQLVRSEDQAPVHVAAETVWKALSISQSREIIPFSTVGNSYGQMEITQIEEMILQTEHGRKRVLKKPWIARAPFPISQGNRYQILLHGETDQLDSESTMSQK